MRIMFEVNHPVDVNVFKYVIRNLQNHGHNVKVIAEEREEIVSKLCKVYGLDFEVVGHKVPSLINKAINMIKIDVNLLKAAKSFDPDLFVTPSSPYCGHISRLLRKPHIGWADTEAARLVSFMAFPLMNTILTPSVFNGKVPHKKHICFNGYKELSYLHPNQFNPDPSILDELGFSKNDKIIIVRLSAKTSTHDVGVKGFNIKKPEKILQCIKVLEEYGQVILKSEVSLGEKFDRYLLSIPLEKFHDLLAFSDLYIGEGTTTASEAGVLGVPWILVSNQTRGYLSDQQKNYGLGYIISNPEEAIPKGIELLENPNIKQEWQKKREKLLKDKIDVTAFLTWFIENYPESFQIMKENPEYQERFK